MDYTNPGGVAWVVVEVVVFTILEDELAVLLVPTPDASRQLPAGPLGAAPTAELAARAALAQALQGDEVWLEQLYTFADPPAGDGAAALSAPGPAPRPGVAGTAEAVSTVRVTYMAVVHAEQVTPRSGAGWFPVAHPPLRTEPARRSIEYAVQRLRSKLEYTTVGFQLLPPRFTLSELQRIYEIILDRTLDKRNFRRRVDVLGIVKPTRERRITGTGRPAQLYRFAATEAPPLDVTPPEAAPPPGVVTVAHVVPRLRRGAWRGAGVPTSNRGGAA